MPLAQEPIFVGRLAEMSTLRWALDRARGGERQLVLLAGEPGVGKSRLARRLLDDASRQGARVLAASCWQWGGAPAMWPWVQVFRELCTRVRDDDARLAERVDRFLDRLGAKVQADAGEGREARFGLFDDAMELLRDASAGTPTVIFIDDVHAADPISVDLLRFFCRDPRPATLLVVATVRDVDADASSEVESLVEDLYREGTVVRLRGLDGDELRELVERIVGQAPSASVVAAIRRSTDGNPLFIDGLVRAALADGALDRLVDGAYSIPPNIRAAIEKRMRHFDGDDRRILTAVAAIGRDCTVDLVAAVTHTETIRAAAVLRKAELESVVVESPPKSCRYSFSHALFADALYLELEPHARMELHRAIATALAGSAGAEIERHASELARHFLSAGPGADLERGIELAVTAGEQALRVFAYDEAAGFFERALEAMELGGRVNLVEKARVLLRLGSALLLSGRPEAARAPLRRLVKMDPSDELFAEAALAMARTGEFAVPNAEAIELLEQADRRLAKRGDALRVKVMTGLAASSWADQRSLERRLQLTEEALRLAESLGDMKSLAFALTARMSALSGPDHLDARLEIVEQMLSAALACGDASLVFEALRWRLNTYWDAGDRVNADLALDEYERLAQRLKWPQALMNAALRRAVLAEMTGDLPAMERALGDLEKHGRRARDPQVEMYLAIGRVALYREKGDLDAVRTALPMARAGCHRWRLLAAPAGALVELSLTAGHDEEARALFEQYAANDFRDLPSGFGTTAGLAMFADACVRLSDVERAAVLRDRLLPYADQNTVAGLCTCKGSVARYLARLELLLGNLDAAATHFEKALQNNRRLGARGFLAYTMRDYARALVQRGRPADISRARSLCAEAKELATLLGFVALQRDLEGLSSPDDVRSVQPRLDNCFIRQGDVWILTFGGCEVQLRDSRGLHYLHRLICDAGRELHVLELSMVQDGAGPTLAGDAGEVFDGQAHATYRNRVEELRQEIADAEKYNDPGRLARARSELDAIAEHLAEGLGLGGRARKMASSSERARVAVSRAIKRAVQKIAEHHPEAGAHFERFTRTGTYCSYDPPSELRVSWILLDEGPTTHL